VGDRLVRMADRIDSDGAGLDRVASDEGVAVCVTAPDLALEPQQPEQSELCRICAGRVVPRLWCRDDQHSAGRTNSTASAAVPVRQQVALGELAKGCARFLRWRLDHCGQTLRDSGLLGRVSRPIRKTAPPAADRAHSPLVRRTRAV
jgi:hypothetical protein